MLSGVNVMYFRIYQELVLIYYYKQKRGKCIENGEVKFLI